LNIVKPIKRYDRSVSAVFAYLARKDNLTTQSWRGCCEVGQRICPKEFEALLFRQEEAPVPISRAGGARRVRDNVHAFRELVMEDI